MKCRNVTNDAESSYSALQRSVSTAMFEHVWAYVRKEASSMIRFSRWPRLHREHGDRMLVLTSDIKATKAISLVIWNSQSRTLFQKKYDFFQYINKKDI